MRGIIGIIAFASVTLGALQGDQNKINKDGFTEAAEGWLQLFDGESTFGWNCSAKEKLSVKGGLLHINGADTIHTTTAFHEFALLFQYRITGAQLHDDVKLIFNGQTAKMAFADPKSTAWRNGKLMVAGNRFLFSTTDFPRFDGEWAKATPSPISFAVANGVQLELRNVTLLPLGQKPLFNGKNLEGWKEFAGKKYTSKFTVNDKLELNVKNGPGDLQSDGKYADFLLQLDCLSNGKQLNSGVFFRCKPNEYQNGYECQIHNGWQAEANKVYSLDHFDPKTHLLLKTEKIKSAAIDGGTGGIYRRIPARKQVAKDFEWFTLTLAAHGNHIATWVNGIQVCDWTDNRPANDNPRNGCRTEAGHISIQGHDPTTDLSFRRIRISEYPTAKK